MAQYEAPFWLELEYNNWGYVATSGEILIRITRIGNTYHLEDREFLTLETAKIFAIAVLKRLKKIDEEGDAAEEDKE